MFCREQSCVPYYRELGVFRIGDVQVPQPNMHIDSTYMVNLGSSKMQVTHGGTYGLLHRFCSLLSLFSRRSVRSGCSRLMRYVRRSTHWQSPSNRGGSVDGWVGRVRWAGGWVGGWAGVCVCVCVRLHGNYQRKASRMACRVSLIAVDHLQSHGPLQSMHALPQ